MLEIQRRPPYAVIAANDSIGRTCIMATLTVRNLDDAVVRSLRIRAAENGRSAEAEHRAILQSTLTGSSQPSARQQVAQRLAEFRLRTGGRGSLAVLELLQESRAARIGILAGTDEAN